MKVAILDISSKTQSQYNLSLCEALVKLGNGVTFLAPSVEGNVCGFRHFPLIKLVPKSWASRNMMKKKVLRAIEVLLNYVLVFFFVLVKRPDVLHIQWLPLTEISSVEAVFLKCYRMVVPKLRIFLTAHNVYPHDIDESKKPKYKKRFLKVDRQIHGYMVHLKSTKQTMHEEFGIELDRLHVAYHGIFYARGYQIKEFPDDGYTHIIMYGTQMPYKGADIFVDALELLPDNYRNRIKAKIVGVTTDELLKKSGDKAAKLGVEWENRYLPEEELYDAIAHSSLILLPYRCISQSGVLLLALSYNKPILTSDLPSFVETLEGYPSDYFFQSESPQSLADLLMRFVDGNIDVELQKDVIRQLNVKYSWEETAKCTQKAYIS